MTWSYSGNPASSALDEVRFLIQDTDTNDQLLSNEELTYLLTAYANDAFNAAIAAVSTLVATASRVQEESKTVGDLSLSIKSGARVTQWQALLATLKAEQFRRNPGAPAYNQNAMVPTVDRVPEDESTDFVVGQMDNNT
jgi:hypothetical protein